MAGIPETRYTRSGDADIAYQVFGAGADLVVIHGFPGHLEVMWELPELAAFLDRLRTVGRGVMVRNPGTGVPGPARHVRAGDHVRQAGPRDVGPVARRARR